MIVRVGFCRTLLPMLPFVKHLKLHDHDPACADSYGSVAFIAMNCIQ